MKNLYYIAIEGAIGVGKTSLTKLLAEKYNARLILEKFEDNPFLPQFYQDRSTYAFQTQLWFLMERYKQQQGLEQMDLFSSYMISDYMFIKDRLFASLNLSDDEMKLYDKVATVLEQDILYPDLVIFLQSDTDNLMSNIASRGRNYESNIDWFLTLNTRRLKQLYKSLEDIWNYRLQLDQNTKDRISPPNGLVFNIPVNDVWRLNNRDSIQEIIINEAMKFNNAVSLEDKKLGYMYFLIGLGTISLECYNSHQWMAWCL